MVNPLTKLFDWQDQASLAARLRRRRFAVVRGLIESLPESVQILDVGGTQASWEELPGWQGRAEICLLNLDPQPVTRPDFRSVVGDARDMREFADDAFDLVFSNSVIEHVGGFDDQRRMADEIRRVGKRYVLQTPNRGFPIEPHFVFPFFDALPVSAKVWLVTHFRLGWYPKIDDRSVAMRAVTSIRLLTKSELTEFFPGATIHHERLFGLTKSFLVCG
jgi:hypothetical protein